MILAERGVKRPEGPETLEVLFLLVFLIITFSNMIESKGSVEGEIGDLSEKIVSVFNREGSVKEGEVVGLSGATTISSGGDLYRGGNFSKVKSRGDTEVVIAEGFKGG